MIIYDGIIEVFIYLYIFKIMKKKYTVIDLFSGAGGLSRGFMMLAIML